MVRCWMRSVTMSLDGFIAGPGHAMDWVFDFVAPDEFPDIARPGTGQQHAVGRRHHPPVPRPQVSSPAYPSQLATAEGSLLALPGWLVPLPDAVVRFGQ